MERLYKETCAEYGCSAKVFTQPEGSMRKQIGTPDLIILFTNTVSHKMIKCALCDVKNCTTRIERCHSSSLSALQGILEAHGKERKVQ